MKKHISIILLLLLCAVPVSAITYPQEYYILNERSNNLINNMLESGTMGLANYEAQVIQTYELRKNNILLEKQNELQAELVKAQWVETCYAPKSVNAGYINSSAWKSECAKAGYPVG